MSDPLATVTSTSTDDATVVVLVGEVDLSNATAVGRQVVAEAAGATSVDLDLQEVAYLDTSGIRVLTELASRPGERWRFVARPGSVAREVLRVAGLVGPLEVVDER